MPMRRLVFLSVVLVLSLTSASMVRGAEAAKPACALVPVPKVYRDQGRTWLLAKPAEAAIVVGATATEPERYAAERLQTLIQRRAKQKVQIVAEGQVPLGVKQLFLLGQRTTNARLDQLCHQRKIGLGPTAPGQDGFVIECLEDAGQQVVLVGGSDPRGVIYGQDVVFDLLRKDGEKVVMPVVSIRDWPSIPWRGRPHSVLRQHLVPGALDAYVRARINFSDVRDDPAVKANNIFPARKASMGCPAGVPLDEPTIKRMVAESHRRGIFLYGTVSCGVPKTKYDDVLKTFRELIGLGVDGLWISFDDVGAGQDSGALIRRVLELGQQHHMTGRAIATTPPSPEYTQIDTPFHREGAKIPGFAEAEWFFTRVPCRADAETARGYGLRRLPGWWHNLVDFGVSGGFLHNGDVLVSLRSDDRPGYVEPQPLSRGWHAPKYENIRDADKYTDHVLLWGVVGGWPEEYEVAALGLWAWNPAAHDWNQFRRAVYRYVYGPSQVDTIWAFDDKLAELKSLFHTPLWHYEPNKGWPCRLKKAADRPRALALIDQMQSLSRKLDAGAPAETDIDPARLETVYLEPMRTTLVYARKMAILDYPEDSLAGFEDRMYDWIDEGNLAAARQALAEVQATTERQLDRIAGELQGLKAIDGYVAYWRQRIAGIESWQRLAKDRRAKMQGRLAKMLRGGPKVLFPYKEATDADLAALFKHLSSPPAGRLLKEVQAGEWLRGVPRWRGAYTIGPAAGQSVPLAAIGYPGHAPSTVDDYGEVRLEVPVPQFQGRLVLDLFVTDTRLDNKWRQYRFMQLCVNERVAWEADIAADQSGREWISVDVTEAAKSGQPLTLAFRVTDRKPVGDHASVTFLGPLRLREAAGR